MFSSGNFDPHPFQLNRNIDKRFRNSDGELQLQASNCKPGPANFKTQRFEVTWPLALGDRTQRAKYSAQA
jgi:hypothetical protein